MKKFFKEKSLIIILWLLLILIFVVGGLYFEHVKLIASSNGFLLRILGGGV